ncbi:MAG: DNA polymerase IV, partial [Candidatus Dormibacteria bacterium]
MASPRAILHLDLDAFFVSCERLRRPELIGRPVVVGGGRESHPGQRREPGRGVVAAASYEARPFGVHSALPLGRALSLCPELVLLPVDIAHYAEVSERVFAILGEYTPLVEPGSLDEAYLDVSGSLPLGAEPLQLATELQIRLQAELGLPASVGVATNKTVAKVASDLRKPRGLVVVAPGEEAAFLAPMPVERLPGAGPRTTAKLRLVGLTTLGQVVAAGPVLEQTLGPAAGPLRRRAAGLDPSPVEVPGLPKSVSREETYSQDLTSQDRLEARIEALATAVARRLRA